MEAKMSGKSFRVSDGDWICPDKKCGNVNFARRTNCNRCGREKTTEAKMMKAGGTEIGKTLADKSRGLFSAHDWQCKTCGNVNWARRSECNMCNTPKYAKLEERTGYGGGFNERENVEYIEREESDGEYDEFGRKKKKYRGKNVGSKSVSKDDEKKVVEPTKDDDDDDDEDDDEEEGGDLSKYKLDDDDEEDDDEEADLSKYNLDASDEEGKSPAKKGSPSGSSRSSSRSSGSSSRSRSRSRSRSSSSSRSRTPSSSQDRARSRRSNSRSSSRSGKGSSSPRKRSRSSSPSSSPERGQKRSRSRSSSGERKKRRSRSRSSERFGFPWNSDMPFVLYALHCLLPDQQWNIGISNTSLSNVMVFCQIKKHAFFFLFFWFVCLFFFPPQKKFLSKSTWGVEVAAFVCSPLTGFSGFCFFFFQAGWPFLRILSLGLPIIEFQKEIGSNTQPFQKKKKK
ncbi:zinc finger Ran-binding domain-containing protein 2 isoform X1 [Anguilla anguilla]|uniref:zinc finger Ran-binding domain-containing protein 2 isoform X1 n=1 Tax=Anguilla anguilla TaxID=7936 RepID=UPI0015B1C584|nr:zinc finger Ran-binding domain-containing protein 2 isoform X1 [Anguilla anguilla]